MRFSFLVALLVFWTVALPAAEPWEMSFQAVPAEGHFPATGPFSLSVDNRTGDVRIVPGITNEIVVRTTGLQHVAGSGKVILRELRPGVFRIEVETERVTYRPAVGQLRDTVPATDHSQGLIVKNGVVSVGGKLFRLMSQHTLVGTPGSVTVNGWKGVADIEISVPVSQLVHLQVETGVGDIYVHSLATEAQGPRNLVVRSQAGWVDVAGTVASAGIYFRGPIAGGIFIAQPLGCVDRLKEVPDRVRALFEAE